MTRQVTFKNDILKFTQLIRGPVPWLYCCFICQSAFWFVLWCKMIIMSWYATTLTLHSLKYIIQHFLLHFLFLWHWFVHVFINRQNNSLPFPWSPPTAAEMINTLAAYSSLSPGNDSDLTSPALILETVMDFNSIRQCMLWFMECVLFLLQSQSQQSVTIRLQASSREFPNDQKTSFSNLIRE